MVLLILMNTNNHFRLYHVLYYVHAKVQKMTFIIFSNINTISLNDTLRTYTRTVLYNPDN